MCHPARDRHIYAGYGNRSMELIVLYGTIAVQLQPVIWLFFYVVGSGQASRNLDSGHADTVIVARQGIVVGKDLHRAGLPSGSIFLELVARSFQTYSGPVFFVQALLQKLLKEVSVPIDGRGNVDLNFGQLAGLIDETLSALCREDCRGGDVGRIEVECACHASAFSDATPG